MRSRPRGQSPQGRLCGRSGHRNAPRAGPLRRRAYLLAAPPWADDSVFRSGERGRAVAKRIFSPSVNSIAIRRIEMFGPTIGKRGCGLAVLSSGSERLDPLRVRRGRMIDEGSYFAASTAIRAACRRRVSCQPSEPGLQRPHSPSMWLSFFQNPSSRASRAAGRMGRLAGARTSGAGSDRPAAAAHGARHTTHVCGISAALVGQPGPHRRGGSPGTRRASRWT